MYHRIQIAGVIDQREAQMLVDAGVDDLGFPLGPGVVKEDLSQSEAKSIIHNLCPPQYAVLITYLDNAQEIIDFCNHVGATKVQLHGDISIKDVSLIKNLAPHIYILKSLVVRQNNLSTLETTVAQLSPFVDAFITDTYDPTTGQHGATGKVHDWLVSEHLVRISARPVILAGGLNPDNVAEAINQVRPAGVDSHTGVERADGRKDETLVRAFVERARKAFSLL